MSIQRRFAQTIAALLIAGTAEVLFPQPAGATDREWIGGLNGAWSTHSNWSPSDAPSSSDHLFVQNGTASTTQVAVDYGGAILFDASSGPSALSLSEGLHVGKSDEGTVSLLNGATITSNAGTLGEYESGTGNMLISGSGTRWTIDEAGDRLWVGYSGYGRLSITEGASVTGPSSTLGFHDGSYGEVLVDGFGSSLVLRILKVGDYGQGSLCVTGGANVISVWAEIGEWGSGEAIVDGPNSCWMITNFIDPFRVGRYGQGTLSITNGGSVLTGSDVEIGDGGILVNGRGSRLQADGDVEVGRGSQSALSITDGGSVVTEEDGFVFSSGSVTINGTSSNWTILQNLAVYGSLRLDGGTLAAAELEPETGGSIDWSTGTLELTGAAGVTLSDTGLLGSYLDLSLGKTLRVAADTTVSSGSTLVLSGGTLETEQLVVTGTALFMGGQTTIRNKLLVQTGGAVEVRDHNLVLASAPNIDAGNLTLDGGLLAVPELVLSPGTTMDLRRGDLRVAGELDNQAGALLWMGTGGLARIDAAGFVNDGIILGGGMVNAPLVNQTGGVALISEDTTFAGEVINNGVLEVNPGVTATYFAPVSGSGSFPGAGMHRFEVGISPGNSVATWEFDGDVQFGPLGVVQIEIGGTGPDDFDRLTIGGSASLAGTLALSLVDPLGGGNVFTPSDGDTFEILTADGGLGGTTFDALSLPALGGGLIWTVDYGLNAIELTVSSLDADLDSDGDVDLADLMTWQREDGTASGLADWRAAFGAGSTQAFEAATVPEPAAFLLGTIAAMGLLLRRGPCLVP